MMNTARQNLAKFSKTENLDGLVHPVCYIATMLDVSHLQNNAV